MRAIRFSVIISAVFVLVSASLAQSKEIQANELQNLEKNAENLLKTNSHRLTVSMEYFNDRDKPGLITRSYLNEVQLPDKWRTVEDELLGDKRTKTERIW